MTDERKQELRHLLQETMKGLQIRFEYSSLPIPIDIYRRYLQEQWSLYGVDYLSFSFSTRFTLFIVGEDNDLKPFYKIDSNSKPLKFIVEELAPFIKKDSIPSVSTGSYIVESGFADGSRIFCPSGGISQQHHILDRLLHIALVRGVEEAVLAFDRSCCPEGVHSFFQDISLVDGIRIETEIQIFEGVKLVPLPSLNTKRTTDEVLRYLPGFPFNAFVDHANSFFGKTLLIIEQPGFSVFHKPPEQLFKSGTQILDLPFQVEEYDMKFRNSKEINAFIKSFFHALSLVCNSSVYIYHLGWFLAADKSLHGHNRTIRTRDPFWDRRPLVGSAEVERAEIDKAKRYYKILDNPNSSISARLQIPIDRWIKSKTEDNPVDKIIDLGIAFESLYVPSKTPGKNRKISFNLRNNASRYLGKDKADQKTLKAKFKAIYELRCDAVHEGQLDKEIEIDQKIIPISKFITEAQDLCRQSIIKILKDGKFPDWNSLILGEESS